MRAFLLAFALPMGLFWGWYLLAANDISMGMFIFSRDMYDLVFDTYGQLMGVDPAILPPLVLRIRLTCWQPLPGYWANQRMHVHMANSRKISKPLSGKRI